MYAHLRHLKYSKYSSRMYLRIIMVICIFINMYYTAHIYMQSANIVYEHISDTSRRINAEMVCIVTYRTMH